MQPTIAFCGKHLEVANKGYILQNRASGTVILMGLADSQAQKSRNI